MGANQHNFRAISNADLAGEFVQGKGSDHEIGREIMHRVLGLAGLQLDEYAKKHLHAIDGQPLVDTEGRPVAVEDYLNLVAIKHPVAIQGILRFVTTDQTSPDFADQRKAVLDTVEAYT